MPDRPILGMLRPPRLDYLAAALPEPVLEPDLPIIDAHHHLWAIDGATDNSLGGHSHAYLLDAFEADAATGHDVRASVFVECGTAYAAGGPPEIRPVGEVAFIAGLTGDALADDAQGRRVRVAEGIVGHADLAAGDAVAPVLDAMIAAGRGRFKGVRHAAGWSDDPTILRSSAAHKAGLYGDARFRAGFAHLARRGLVFDAMLFHPQLADAADLAAAFPDATIVLNHCGGPLGTGSYAGRQAEVFAAWRAGLALVASRPNVRLKLGGLMLRLGAFDYWAMAQPPFSAGLAALWRPYLLTGIELFGPDRCIFVSNFPVDKMGVPYRTLWNAFKRVACGSDAERAALFAGTAARTYSLRPVVRNGPRPPGCGHR